MAAVAALAGACGDGIPRITTVEVAATPCDRPTARLGVGTVIDGGLVLTAAHVVEEDLRVVNVDGRPARVVALDARVDAAVLALDSPIDDRAATISDIDLADRTADAVRIVTPTQVIDTTVERIVTLAVDDTTDGVVRRRQALALGGVVPAGTSGAPVVDGDRQVVGIVTITHLGRDITYATRTGDLRALIDAASASVPGAVPLVACRSGTLRLGSMASDRMHSYN